MINVTLAVVAVFSMIVAAIATAIAWVTVRDERRRTAARVAVLAAAIHDHDDQQPRTASSEVPRSPSLFGDPAVETRTRFAIVGAVALVAVGAVTGLVLVAESGSRGRSTSGLARVEGPPDVPLELVALEHERDESRLVVHGIVRNPPSAAKLNGLTAVVLVFSKEGAYIASARAPVAIAPLVPGAETPFVVTLPDADSVDRYRVSFRTDDHIVPHIDRRDRNPVARTE